jgi:osomolarity two-component system, response regulator SSK1
LDGTVPPINVLLVEDNVINLKLLEAFMKRLKVRWKSAQDGKEAVEKWRQGGFHLVLMDIQLPVMNGLQATKEIRRLEGVNGIGVFGEKSDPVNGAATSEIKEEDKLEDRSGFKSPVIIVALTASSLQSDRHEALAAGCNDFLTKVSTIYSPSIQTNCELTGPSSRSISCGWSAKSRNGAACKL